MTTKTARVKKYRHIDISGLPKGYDIADLVDSGVTGDELVAWCKDRIKDGPPTVPAEEPKQKKPRTKAKPKPKAAPASKGQAAAQPKPEPEEEPDTALDIPPEYSEDSLAEDFSKRFHRTLVFCPGWGTWLHWEDNRWKTDETCLALDLARKVCREHATNALENFHLGNKRERIASAISTRRTFGNVEAIAKTDRRQVVTPTMFDADPWTLNSPAGIIDLKTGKLRAAKRGDWCSKQVAVGPSTADCPLWKRFLREATEDDAELAAYLQRVAGYCLTGSISEHVFFFAYGGGGNGKGTFMNTLLWLLNDYAKVAQMETFTKQRFTDHPAEIAFFQGARVVTASETEAGSRWHESRIKQMTGGDPITARLMRENPFTYLPTFKLLFAGNNKPHLRNVDEAMKRRLFLIPFDKTIPKEKQDGELGEKLKAEGPQILNWCIEGCLSWQENTLDAPDRVIATTQEYFDTEDKIGSFLDDCCAFGESYRCRTTYLYNRFCKWAEKHGEYSPSHRVFLDMMATKGHRPEKRAGEAVFIGLMIAYEDDADQAGESRSFL